MNHVEQSSAAGGQGEERSSATPQSRQSATSRATSTGRFRRWEVGFFIRKIVNGRVVREWKFPRGSARPLSRGDQSREQRELHALSAPSSSDLPGEGDAGGPAAAFAAEPPAPPPPPPPPPSEPETETEAGVGGSEGEEVRFEVGVFVSSSTFPGEYKDPPDG